MKTKRLKRKMDRGNALAISAIVLCFMLTIGLAGLLNGGGFLSALSWKQGGVTYFGLASGGYDDILLARQDAELVKQRGGAGFVLLKDNMFHLLLNVYTSKKDAETVLEKQPIGSYLVEIYIPEYDYSWCREGQRTVIETSVAVFPSVFKALYEIANQLDKAEIVTTEAKNKLSIEQGKLEIAKTDLTKLGFSAIDKWQSLSSALQATITLVDALQNPSADAPFVSQIRYKSISILLLGGGL